MSRNKSSQSTKTFSTKKSSQRQPLNNSSYQSYYLWVSFLWSLITLGMVGQRVGVQGQGLPATLDLASLMASQGTVIQGAAVNDFAGASVSSAGDVNGDGISDLLVGAINASPLSRSQAGVVYLIYGSRVLPAMLDLKALTQAQGIVIQGAMAFDEAGISVSSAGDVNGDGKSDILVGALTASPQGRTQAGTAYLIYGSRTLPAVLDLNALIGSQGMVIQGAGVGDQTGVSVSSAGDVNGDGISDILVGAHFASPLSRSYAGAVYLIYGSSRTLPAVLDLATPLTATQGMVIQGAVANDWTGSSVSSAEDVNGDGISDILVGAVGASPLRRINAGAVTLIYGSRALPATLDLATLTQAQGTVIQGAGVSDRAGTSVSSAGDVNGDGINDLMIGASNASPVSRSQAGTAYLIYGSKALPVALDLNALTLTQGTVIQGAGMGDQTGVSVSSAGDVNGDGLSDLVVGAPQASPVSRNRAGATYLIYGSRTLSAVLDLATTLTPTQGVVFQGAVANDRAGFSVASAGDVNGDGIADLVVGASQASPVSRSQAGTAYVIYGKSAVTITSLMATPSTNPTSVTTLSINTSPSTAASLGATPSTAIMTSGMATGVSAGTTIDTASSTASLIASPASSASSSPVISTGSPLSTGATMTAAPQTLPLLPSDSTITSANSARSESLRGSGESTITVSDVTETNTQATKAGESLGGTSTVIGIAVGAGLGGIALTACLAGVGFYACRKKPGAKKPGNAELDERGVQLRNTENYSTLQLSDRSMNSAQDVLGMPAVGERNENYGAIPRHTQPANSSLHEVSYQVGPISNLNDKDDDEEKKAAAVYSAF
jgi:hypothetical protein